MDIITSIGQIRKSDISFVDSSHTQNLLEKFYNVKTYLFYSPFIAFLKKDMKKNRPLEDRKYEYGLIVHDFDKKIKNIEKSIDFLKDKTNVLLIGKNSHKYKQNGFECLDHVHGEKYYEQIKCIVQDSFYESCSQVKIEGMMNGCMIHKNYHHYHIIVSSTQFPGYGGAATNAYAIIKFLRKQGFRVAGIFFHNDIHVDKDPDKIGGIFLYPYKYHEHQIRSDINAFFKNKRVDLCIAKNYLAPTYCKNIFQCFTIYLVAGISHMSTYYARYSAQDVLSRDFKIDSNHTNPHEIKCNTCSDLIVLNSDLSRQLFQKIYPTMTPKIYPDVIDTSNLLNNIDKHTSDDITKTNDILICCSDLQRRVKNNTFLHHVLSDVKFHKFQKIIIGKNNQEFRQIPNSQCFPLMKQQDVILMMKKSRILLFPSLFDANPSTVREAYRFGCLPLVSKNIGFWERYPRELVCDSFELKEWREKLLYLLENNEKDYKIHFNTSNDGFMHLIDNLLDEYINS